MSKRAIIVGASSGIGRELAASMARDGFMVGICARRSENLQQLHAMHPNNIVYRTIDITAENAAGELGELIGALGGMDIMVFCSGTGHINPGLAVDPEIETIGINTTAFTKVVCMAFDHFCKQGHGHLAAITSVMGLRGSAHAPAYAATKAYQVNYLEGLRQKAAKEKLKKMYVSDLRPGSVQTDMMKGEGHFWISSPEKAAMVIRKGIRRKKRVCYVTQRWQVIGTLLKIMPRRMYEKL